MLLLEAVRGVILSAASNLSMGCNGELKMRTIRKHLENSKRFKKALAETYHYEDGKLISSLSNRAVGSKKKKGCYEVVFRWEGKRYYLKSHRVIWFLETGKFPKSLIDHIDRNPFNNNIENLREATSRENSWNSLRDIAKKTSQYKGVDWHVASKKWRATIRLGSGSKHIGVFTSEIEAALAFNRAASIHHGQFAKLNVILGDK